MWSIIATWKMAYQGVCKAAEMLDEGSCAGDAVVAAVQMVEAEPSFTSVGLGGLPNEEGTIQLDGAYMDGATLRFGAVGAVENIASAVELARNISETEFNCLLVAGGAGKEALRQGMQPIDLSTKKSQEEYRKRLNHRDETLSSYNDHDTVGVVGRDQDGHLVAATSTSGLFMKKDGRLGDSPIIGSGFYADDEIGAAAATGVGEDIMKGCLSYEVVRLMKDGIAPQKAAEKAVFELSEKLRCRIGKANSISVVCMNKQGEWGVGTNCPFAFVAADAEHEAKVFYAEVNQGKVVIREVRKDDQVD